MNRNLKSELGRGMVEIIGVLAIIGILSIVSVFAYKRAMDKNTTNEVIAALSRRAVIASSQKEMGAKVNLEEFDDEGFTEQYNITYQDEDEDFFSITMENVPDEVVQNLIRMKWKTPYNMYVNGIQINDYDVAKKAPKKTSFAAFFVKPAHAEGQGSQIKIIFHKKLEGYDKQAYMDKGTCTGSGGRWDGDRCFCGGKDMTESGCKACRPYLKDGVSKCGQGDGKNEDDEDVICYRDSECRGCLEVCENGKCVLNKDDKCNGEEYCEGTKIVTCTRSGSKDTACASSTQEVKDCTDGGKKAYTCSMESGRAECVGTSEDCEDGQFKDKDGNCVSCSTITESGYLKDGSECDTCSGVKVIGDYCATKCSSGKFGGTDGYPILTQPYERFGSDNPSSSLSCWNCSDIRQEGDKAYSASADKTNCSTCPGIEIISHSVFGRGCVRPCESGYVHDDTGKCIKAGCASGEFKDKDGNCVSCSTITESGYLKDGSECDTCSGVKVIDGYCATKCPNGQFGDKDGYPMKGTTYERGGNSRDFFGCFDCSSIRQEGDNTYSGDASTTNCDICPDVEIVEQSIGRMCMRRCDSGYERNSSGRCVKVGCDSGYFKGEDGTCLPCSGIKQEGESVTTSSADTTDCESCSNVDVLKDDYGNKICAPKCSSNEFHIGPRCYSCSNIKRDSNGTVTSVDADHTDCAHCSNVDVVTNGQGNNVCTPKCGSDEYRMQGETSCRSCSVFKPDSNLRTSARISDCGKCPNVVIVGNGDVCIGKCEPGYERDANSNYFCVKTGCESGEFKDKNGNCVSCGNVTDYPQYTVDGTDCLSCSGVEVFASPRIGDVCVRPCETGKARDWRGLCTKCADGYEQSVDGPCVPQASCMANACSCVNYADTHPCECYESYAKNNPEECGTGCAQGEFKDANGNCISCELITWRNEYSVDETECAKCPGVSFIREVQSMKKFCTRR